MGDSPRGEMRLAEGTTTDADAPAAAAGTERAGDAALLEVRGLTKEFGPVRAVDDLSFSVRTGEIVGLLGPNGAGKTTAMRMLVGYLVPSRGTIRMAGGDIFREGPRLKAALGYLPENIPLYGEMTVQEYLQMAARLKGLRRQGVGRAVERVVALLSLEPMWRRPTGQLSRGFRQRVGLAQCMLTDPSLLILDEPATGLDPNQISEFRRQLRAWRPRKAILLSTHILAEALMLCDRVLIMSRGRLAASGSPQGLTGPDEGPISTQVTVRAGEDDPLQGFAHRDAVTPTSEPPGERGRTVWRLEGRLDRVQRLALMRHLAQREVEVVEWNTGLSALEQLFRRLTLEEGRDRAAVVPEP